jgi:chemotaxis protein histidine kinase CheA
MAHSMKSMAASLEYESIAQLAHRLEDRMEAVRSAGRACSVDDLPLLFRGLAALEAMLARVAETGAAPDGDAALLAALEPSPAADDAEKKVLT